MVLMSHAVLGCIGVCIRQWDRVGAGPNEVGIGPKSHGTHNAPFFLDWNIMLFWVEKNICVSGSIDRTRPGYPSRVPRVVPPSEVPLYNP